MPPETTSTFIRPKRLDAARKSLADMGGSFKSIFMTMGAHDLVAIYEAPDDAVAARFTLGVMPGRQRSIDADLGAGLIDETGARRRREEIQRYADFYGAMDGAAKFVRGDAIAGLIIEPMQGAGGQVPTPPGYLAGLKEICQRHGIYLIYDESQTAFGRCGAMSAAEYYGVAPDMMALTKGLGGGFAVGALLAREDLKNLNAAEEHTTFGSSPVAFAAALATIEVMERLGL